MCGIIEKDLCVFHKNDREKRIEYFNDLQKTKAILKVVENENEDLKNENNNLKNEIYRLRTYLRLD